MKLFLWQKPPPSGAAPKGTILFVHGSSMASQPTFDLQVPGRPDSSAMDWFAARGFDTWCMDHEGYGRSDKTRPINCDIANGADDLAAGTEVHTGENRREEAAGLRHLLGRAARGAVRRSAIPSAWRGSPSTPSSGPARAARRSPSARKSCPSSRRRTAAPIDRAFVRSIFTRDHPGTADEATIEAFASAILALDDSVPTGTYVDMCSKLPLVDPAKISVPTIVMRGEFDGIAGFEDLVEFFSLLPNPDKQFAVMAGHLARELPAEELPHRLPRPAFVLHHARPGVSRMKRVLHCSRWLGSHS